MFGLGVVGWGLTELRVARFFSTKIARKTARWANRYRSYAHMNMHVCVCVDALGCCMHAHGHKYHDNPKIPILHTQGLRNPKTETPESLGFAKP